MFTGGCQSRGSAALLSGDRPDRRDARFDRRGAIVNRRRRARSRRNSRSTPGRRLERRGSHKGRPPGIANRRNRAAARPRRTSRLRTRCSVEREERPRAIRSNRPPAARRRGSARNRSRRRTRESPCKARPDWRWGRTDWPMGTSRSLRRRRTSPYPARPCTAARPRTSMIRHRPRSRPRPRANRSRRARRNRRTRGHTRERPHPAATLSRTSRRVAYRGNRGGFDRARRGHFTRWSSPLRLFASARGTYHRDVVTVFPSP